MAIEPLIFLTCIICFLSPILLRKIMLPLQVGAGILLVFAIMAFHDEVQVKMIYLIAFIWVFGSISALSIKRK
ncbi:hypothetical protein A3849_12495 [Paenibacillus sp. P46E]|nr:hypothetical protein A3849_12495 [Paenibacillus sp. P46E]